MKLIKSIFGIFFMAGIILTPQYISAQLKSSEKIIIVVDPGHGGRDSGAIGVNGIQEKEVVLKLALHMQKLNQEVFQNKFEIYLTRYSDTLISLSDRSKIARSLKADFYISLHCNHSPVPDAKGIEVYISRRNGINKGKSTYLAYQIEKSIAQRTGIKSRGVKFSDFQVLWDVVEISPSILIELGFVSNPDEAVYLGDSRNLEVLSLAILSVIN
ncbi:N-acetylmuramoyl-L-alanine amidase family protein [Christiangramia echinicola]|uniref:N-acetylmuramoyl-L-alanine amidase n=1 Tax=Christiangramia echinicola TaxID=279359 RepID=A0A1H1RIV0_9FLAO|nr:N-acetylmuramoyl-L-alanine amidase [Christiangramia echinicola]SDS35456.1 N-acetylmuramoyl-L-alanine amidase [Christiangramia echinicola]